MDDGRGLRIVILNPTASEREKNNLKGLDDFYLNAKAIIGP